MVPFLPFGGVQSDGHGISAPWLILVDHLSPDGPIPAFNTEEAVECHVRYIQEIPRLS
jgi:hypothetical protein